MKNMITTMQGVNTTMQGLDALMTQNNSNRNQEAQAIINQLENLNNNMQANMFRRPSNTPLPPLRNRRYSGLTDSGNSPN